MAAPKLLSAEEYFAIDDASEIKHELVNGEIWAMAGGSANHALLSMNIGVTLGHRLRGGKCRIYSSDLRIAVAHQTFAYPDATVVCGPLERWPGNDTITNPTVVFEVLSPTTERYDRGMKRILYSRVESMKAVVLISQDQPLVEVYERQNGDWLWRTYEGLDAVAKIAPLGIEMPLSDLFAGVEW